MTSGGCVQSSNKDGSFGRDNLSGLEYKVKKDGRWEDIQAFSDKTINNFKEKIIRVCISELKLQEKTYSYSYPRIQLSSGFLVLCAKFHLLFLITLSSLMVKPLVAFLFLIFHYS